MAAKTLFILFLLHMCGQLYDDDCVTAQLYEQRVKALVEAKQLTEAQLQLQRIRQTRAEFFKILRWADIIIIMFFILKKKLTDAT